MAMPRAWWKSNGLKRMGFCQAVCSSRIELTMGMVLSQDCKALRHHHFGRLFQHGQQS
jgi:hypothetical protein